MKCYQYVTMLKFYNKFSKLKTVQKISLRNPNICVIVEKAAQLNKDSLTAVNYCIQLFSQSKPQLKIESPKLIMISYLSIVNLAKSYHILRAVFDIKPY